MKNIFSSFLFLLFSNLVFGQIEWVGNHSFFETATDLVRTSQNQYILVHNGLTVFDSMGNIVFSGLTNDYPDADGGRFSEIVELPDSSIALGMEFLECDVLINGVVKYDKNWNETAFNYSMVGAGVAGRFSDNSLLFADYSSIEKFGENGGSIWNQYLQGMTVTDLVITPGDTVLLATDLGLIKMTADGDMVGNPLNLVCERIELLPNGNYLVQTGVMLQVFSPDFSQVAFFQQQGEAYKDIFVGSDEIAVLTSANKVLRFDLGLNPIGTFQLSGQQQIFEAIVLTDNGIMAAGSEQFGNLEHGNTSALIKEFGFDGSTANTNTDAALTGISHGLNIEVSHNWGLFTVTIPEVKITVKNNGPTIVDRLNVNCNFYDVEMFPCYLLQEYSKEFEDLNLPSGASKELVWGEQKLYTWDYPSGQQLELCYWTSLPNHHLETNNDNDVSCTSVLVNSHETFPVYFDQYYNPVADVLTFELKSALDAGNATANIFNAAGQLVLSEKVSGTSQSISVGDLPDGVYFLQILSGSRVGVGRFAKY